jgi:hypothetical protein
LNYYRKGKVVFCCFTGLFLLKILVFICAAILLTPDSHQYVGINGFDLFSLRLNEYRMPLYPLLIEIFQRVFGEKGLLGVCIIQMIVAYISAIYLFKTCNLLSRKKYIGLLFTMMYAVSPAIIGWDKTMLTESFALSLTVFLLYHIVCYLKSPNSRSAINSAVIVFTGTFIRPTFALYAGIMFAFFVLRAFVVKSERRIALKSAACLAVPLILIFGYATLFSRQYQQFSLSNSLLGQQVTVMAQSGLYSYSGDTEIVAVIDRERAEPDFFEHPHYARRVVMENYDRPRINTFVNEIKRSHPVAYLKGLGHMVSPRAGYFDSYAAWKLGIIAKLFAVYHLVFSPPFMSGVWLGVLLFSILLYRGVRRKKCEWLYLGCVVFITFTYCVSVFGTNSEFPRTAITALPFMTLALFQLFNDGIDFIKKTTDPNIVGDGLKT